LIEEIRLVPEDDHLEIELAGDLAAILALTASSKKPVTMDRDGLRGTRNQLSRMVVRTRERVGDSNR
jgi:hypothetical protein